MPTHRHLYLAYASTPSTWLTWRALPTHQHPHASTHPLLGFALLTHCLRTDTPPLACLRGCTLPLPPAYTSTPPAYTSTPPALACGVHTAYAPTPPAYGGVPLAWLGLWCACLRGCVLVRRAVLACCLAGVLAALRGCLPCLPCLPSVLHILRAVTLVFYHSFSSMTRQERLLCLSTPPGSCA